MSFSLRLAPGFLFFFGFFYLYHVVTLLQVLVPITEDVGVSYELHRFIIGQKGSGIRKMMEEYEVNFILLPPAGQVWWCSEYP